VLATDRVTSDRRFKATLRKALRDCLDFWRDREVDLAGYNTIQNARDLDDLRRHLGAEKLVLWGTSYGAHLALAALKEMEGGIAKVVISSVRGLHQSVKLPNSVEPYLDRLQQAGGSAYPDIRPLMRRVHSKLEREPVHVKVKRRDGTTIDYLLQRRDMQLLAVSLMADPSSMARALNMYLALDRGEDPGIDRIPARFLPDYLTSPGEPLSLECMQILTNVSSGMSESRRRDVYAQSRTALFGPYLDWILPYDGMARRLDVGAAFRESPSSDVPVLVFSGTLDGRTILEDQLEGVRGLRNAVTITVENAGHNLFDAPPRDLLGIIDRFMTGQSIEARAKPGAFPPRDRRCIAQQTRFVFNN
jgi:pimeloyl-ACP methyl ester carboxylesterase